MEEEEEEWLTDTTPFAGKKGESWNGTPRDELRHRLKQAQG